MSNRPSDPTRTSAPCHPHLPAGEHELLYTLAHREVSLNEVAGETFDALVEKGCVQLLAPESADEMGEFDVTDVGWALLDVEGSL